MNKQYKKINFYVNGKYICSTTWHRTCKEALSSISVDKDGYIYLIGSKYPLKEVKATYK